MSRWKMGLVSARGLTPFPLEARVRIHLVDSGGLFEARDRLGVLAALLIDQSKLKLRVGVVRVERRRFHHALEVLPRAKSLRDVADIAAKRYEQEIEDKGRGQKRQHAADNAPRSQVRHDR